MKFSAQQTTFLDWAENGKGSAILEAVAGAGKTTTLLEAARRMKGKKCIVAFGKSIALELQAKVKDDADITASTVHSLGYSAFRRQFKNAFLDKFKTDKVIEKMGVPQDLLAYVDVTKQLVGMAKNRGIGVMDSIDNDSAWFDMADHFDVFSRVEKANSGKEIPEKDIIHFAQQVLHASNKITDGIDYDDMVYLPLALGCRFWQYDVVMVDEAQDTNETRRALVRAITKKGGRVVAVGDRHQAIFGFTGADENSLDLIAQDHSAIRLPLTTTYRCPKAVVKFAQQWVSHIQSAETSPEGLVSETTTTDLLKRNDLNGHSAILCRNTAPLVGLAFKLIRNRIACKIEGRDIGNGLIKLAQRWKVKTTDALLVKLDEYKQREHTKALARKQELKAQQIDDTVETMRVIIESVNAAGNTDVASVVTAISAMFDDNVHKMGILVLSTVHKSKGREWQRVYWLNRNDTCPSKYARQPWQMQQEKNLMYVCATRAKNELIDLTD